PAAATTKGPANGPPRLSSLRDRRLMSLSAGRGRCQRSELRERFVFDPFLFDPEFDPETGASIEMVSSSGAPLGNSPELLSFSADSHRAPWPAAAPPPGAAVRR